MRNTTHSLDKCQPNSKVETQNGEEGGTRQTEALAREGGRFPPLFWVDGLNQCEKKVDRALKKVNRTSKRIRTEARDHTERNKRLAGQFAESVENGSPSGLQFGRVTALRQGTRSMRSIGFKDEEGNTERGKRGHREDGTRHLDPERRGTTRNVACYRSRRAKQLRHDWSTRRLGRDPRDGVFRRHGGCLSWQFRQH